MIGEPRSDLPAEQVPQPGELRLDRCGRHVLGFIVAAFVPGMLFGFALAISFLISDERFSPGGLVTFPVFGAVLGLFTTLPTILFAGLPAYFLYMRLGWTDLPRCLLGGLLIGWGVGLVTFGSMQAIDISSLFDLEHWRRVMPMPLHIGCALLGAASVIMLWSVIYRRHSWLVFAGLIALCPPITWLLA